MILMSKLNDRDFMSHRVELLKRVKVQHSAFRHAPHGVC